MFEICFSQNCLGNRRLVGELLAYRSLIGGTRQKVYNQRTVHSSIDRVQAASTVVETTTLTLVGGIITTRQSFSAHTALARILSRQPLQTALTAAVDNYRES